VDGLRLIFRLQPLRVLFVSLLLTSLGEGVFGTLLPPFVSKILHGGAPEFGYLMAAQAVGGLLGGLLIGRAAKNAPAKALIGLGSLGLGLGDLAIFNYPAFYPKLAPGLVLFALVGVPAVCAGIGVSTLVQRVVSDAYRGRVFASAGAVAAFASLLGAAGAGLLGDRLGILFVLNTQGIVYILAGLLALTALPHIPPKAEAVATSYAPAPVDAIPSSGMPL
jgi:MFS family permease